AAAARVSLLGVPRARLKTSRANRRLEGDSAWPRRASRALRSEARHLRTNRRRSPASGHRAQNRRLSPDCPDRIGGVADSRGEGEMTAVDDERLGGYSTSGFRRGIVFRVQLKSGFFDAAIRGRGDPVGADPAESSFRLWRASATSVGADL